MQLCASGISSVREGLWKLVACQLWPPSELGQPSTHSPTLCVEDVVAVPRLAGLAVEAGPDVLEQRLGVIDVLARAAVELPQHAVFADREHPLAAAAVDEHALEHDVEIERLARRVLVVPRELARLYVERDGRARVQPGVESGHAAARRHPGLCLRGAPVREPELGIIAAGDPGFAAGAIQIGQIAPGVAAGPIARRDRGESPLLLARARVVGTDEALLLLVRLACAHAFDHEPVRDQRAAAACVTVRHLHVPRDLRRCARSTRSSGRWPAGTACRRTAPCRASRRLSFK